jgi:sugar O-acyltransferase (sialic acid O-acetyltransferase NeuD family)
MRHPVIVLGSGGHARVLIDALRLRSVEIIGIADEDRREQVVRGLQLAYLGDDKHVMSQDPSRVRLVNGVGSIGIPKKRIELFDRFKKAGFIFLSVIHPSATVSSRATFGEGVQVMAGAIVQCGVVVGSNAIINTGASVDHDCHLEAHAHLAPGVVLSGDVHVGEAAHIGTGAIATQGTRVPPRVLVKAGTRLTGRTFKFKENKLTCKT